MGIADTMGTELTVHQICFKVHIKYLKNNGDSRHNRNTTYSITYTTTTTTTTITTDDDDDDDDDNNNKEGEERVERYQDIVHAMKVAIVAIMISALGTLSKNAKA